MGGGGARGVRREVYGWDRVGEGPMKKQKFQLSVTSTCLSSFTKLHGFRNTISIKIEMFLFFPFFKVFFPSFAVAL